MHLLHQSHTHIRIQPGLYCNTLQHSYTDWLQLHAERRRTDDFYTDDEWNNRREGYFV